MTFPPFTHPSEFAPGLIIWCQDPYEVNSGTGPTQGITKLGELRPCLVVAVNMQTRLIQVARLCETEPRDTTQWLRIDSTPAIAWKNPTAWIWIGEPAMLNMHFNKAKYMHPHKDTQYTTPAVCQQNFEAYSFHRRRFLAYGPMATGMPVPAPAQYPYPSTSAAHMNPWNPLSSSGHRAKTPSTSVSGTHTTVPTGFTQTNPAQPGWWRNPETDPPPTLPSPGAQYAGQGTAQSIPMGYGQQYTAQQPAYGQYYQGYSPSPGQYTSNPEASSYFNHQHASMHLGGNYPTAPSSARSSVPTSQPAGSHARSSSTSSTANRVCHRCGATNTPLWRREPGTQRSLCNACGLYAQHRHIDRPQALIDADAGIDSRSPYAESSDGTSCSHCGTNRTSVWRRNKAGNLVCNACGCYERLNGRPRPLELAANRIRPRSTKQG
ncbi:hypothetical protein MKEN_00974000 [Mycena kentingensis (nom. inval.)]|nr:hypothetical protein MKEN_00974000 [Mycena kentingensis (nom. inval.)]